MVRNSSGQQVYFAAENSDCCSRNFIGATRQFDMHILDNVQREVIHLFRPFSCAAFCFGQCYFQVCKIRFHKCTRSALIYDFRKWKSLPHPVLLSGMLSKNGIVALQSFASKMPNEKTFCESKVPNVHGYVVVMWSFRYATESRIN